MQEIPEIVAGSNKEANLRAIPPYKTLHVHSTVEPEHQSMADILRKLLAVPVQKMMTASARVFMALPLTMARLSLASVFAVCSLGALSAEALLENIEGSSSKKRARKLEEGDFSSDSSLNKTIEFATRLVKLLFGASVDEPSPKAAQVKLSNHYHYNHKGRRISRSEDFSSGSSQGKDQDEGPSTKSAQPSQQHHHHYYHKA